MKLKSIDAWDADFFTEFLCIFNDINKDHVFFSPETLEKYQYDFSPEAAFNSRHFWKAFLLETDEIEGRCLISLPKDGEGSFASLGYFELKNNDQKKADKLLTAAVEWAKKHGVGEIRGPIQGNIFNSYKFKLAGEWSIVGDPIHPVYYPKLFATFGFEQIASWSNLKVTRLGYALKLLSIFLEVPRTKGLVAREYDPSNKESELKTLYDLMMDSYQNMHSFQPCSFEEFFQWNQHILSYLKPGQFLFAEYQGLPVGFGVNFKGGLVHASGKSETRILLGFVGRKRGLGKKVRGVANCLSRYTLTHYGKDNYLQRPIITGVYQNSPIRLWLMRIGMSELTRSGLFQYKIPASSFN